MNKKINLILIIVAIIGGIIYGMMKISNQDFYGFLICISIIPVMLVPFFLKRFFHIKLSFQVETMYLIFVFFAHFLGSIVNFYHLILGYDKIMHFISGMLSTFLAFLLLVKLNQYNKKNVLFTILFVVGITLSIAALWEFYEFTSDFIFNKDAQNVLTTGVADTMWDMLMAFFGSILVCFQYFVEIKYNKNLVVSKFLKEVGE